MLLTWISHGDTVISESIGFIFGCHISSSSHWHVLASIKFGDSILCCFGQVACLYCSQALVKLWFLVRCVIFASAIANEDDPDVFGMRSLRRLLTISWSELRIGVSMRAWGTTNFHLFHGTYLGRLLMIEAIHSDAWYHLVTYVAREFVGRTLIRISNSFILIGALVWIAHCVMTVVFLMHNSHVPIALWKSTNSCHALTLFVCVGHELAATGSTDAWKHSGGILISNGVLSSL